MMGNDTVSTTFVITVSAVNDAPTVANVISDFTVSEDASPSTTDLSGVFTDVEGTSFDIDC